MTDLGQWHLLRDRESGYIRAECINFFVQKTLTPRFTGDAIMIFRQLFDSVSGTYTYLLASRRGGEALIIDPVIEKVDRYLQLIGELDLRLVKAVDTHLHADHVTGLGALRDRTHCITVMGEQSKADVVSMRLGEGEKLTVEGVSLDVLYTPGHTDDSYSYLMGDRVFTGDTLLIRGTGRTDFQNGDPRAQYDSIFNKLLKLPEDTLVFPAHDYKGEQVSTIGEETRVQSAPAGEVGRRIRRADEQPEAPQPEDDGRGGARQHEGRARAGRDRAARLGGERRGRDGAGRAARRRIHRPAREGRAGEARRDPGLAARALRRSQRQYRARRDVARAGGEPSGCCSTARSASAPPWRCRPRRTRGSPRPATCRAASTPGRRRKVRSSGRKPHEAKVALITGAAHGIGRATVRQLLDEGWLVGAVDVSAADLERAFGKQARRVRMIEGDIGDEATAKRAVAETIERFGQLDGVVSNAGIMIRKPIRQLTIAEWRRVLDVNLTAAFLLAKAAERPLRASEGAFVSIASTRAAMSEPNTEAYSASKGGLVALTHALAMSLAPVRVNCVSPGWIATRTTTSCAARITCSIRPAVSASRRTSPRSSPGCSTASAPASSPERTSPSTAA